MIDPVVAQVATTFFIPVLHLDGALICLQVAFGSGLFEQMLVEDVQYVQSLPDPSFEGGGGYGDVLSFKPLPLAVERQVIHVFIDQDGCQQTGAGNAFLDHPAGREPMRTPSLFLGAYL